MTTMHRPRSAQAPSDADADALRVLVVKLDVGRAPMIRTVHGAGYVLEPASA